MTVDTFFPASSIRSLDLPKSVPQANSSPERVTQASRSAFQNWPLIKKWEMSLPPFSKKIETHWNPEFLSDETAMPSDFPGELNRASKEIPGLPIDPCVDSFFNEKEEISHFSISDSPFSIEDIDRLPDSSEIIEDEEKPASSCSNQCVEKLPEGVIQRSGLDKKPLEAALNGSPPVQNPLEETPQITDPNHLQTTQAGEQIQMFHGFPLLLLTGAFRGEWPLDKTLEQYGTPDSFQNALFKLADHLYPDSETKKSKKAKPKVSKKLHIRCVSNVVLRNPDAIIVTPTEEQNKIVKKYYSFPIELIDQALDGIIPDNKTIKKYGAAAAFQRACFVRNTQIFPSVFTTVPKNFRFPEREINALPTEDLRNQAREVRIEKEEALIDRSKDPNFLKKKRENQKLYRMRHPDRVQEYKRRNRQQKQKARAAQPFPA